MFSSQGPSLPELAVQALSSVESGYDLLAPKFDHTPFRTPDGVLNVTADALRLLRPVRPGIGRVLRYRRGDAGSSHPCARDRSWASTSALACSRRRAVRTPAPSGYGPTSGPCPSPGPSTWRSVSERSGTSCPPSAPRCSPACGQRAAAWRGVRLPGRRAAARHLRLVLDTARVRPGHAGPQCGMASPVRHVLPHLPAARGPPRPDSIRIHRGDSPLDGSRPARTGSRGIGLSSRAEPARPDRCQRDRGANARYAVADAGVGQRELTSHTIALIRA